MSKYERLLNILREDAQVVNKSLGLHDLEGSEVTITGATGLLGVNIIAALVFYNSEFATKKIRINAVSYRKPSGFITELFKSKNVISFFGDIADQDFVSTIPMAQNIIHSAGYAQPGKFMDDRIKTISINTTATAALLKRLKNNGRFLFLSSSEVYSGSASLSSNELDIGTTNPSHPRACYIEGKRTGEAIVNAARYSGIKATSARLALAYGPGTKLDDQRVMNQLIIKGINNEISLLDSGEAVRTYGYISDVVTMLLNMLIKNESAVYNTGGKSVITIRDLALKIGEFLDVPVKIPEIDSYMNHAPQEVGLDLSKIENEYGNKTYVDIEYGLTKTIDWVKALHAEA